MQPIEVQTAKSYWRRMGCLGMIFGGIALLMLASAIKSLVDPSPFESVGSVAIRLLVVVVLCAIPALLLYLSRRTWVLRIDAQGVQRRDGKRFGWDTFSGVRAIRRKGRGPINHYELHFRDGSAGLFYQVIENQAEVLAFLSALERGTNPFRG